MRHVSIQADPLSKHASAEERVWASARLGNAALLMAGLFGAWWLLITAVITVNAPPELRQWRFGTLEHWVDVVLAASFVVFCDSFNIPLVLLADTPGFLVGMEGERRKLASGTVLVQVDGFLDARNTYTLDWERP